MPNGYHGKILHVNLTHRTLTTEEPSRGFLPQVHGRKRAQSPLSPERNASGRRSPRTRQHPRPQRRGGDRRTHFRPKPDDGDRQIAPHGRYRGFAMRRILAGGAEICRFRWNHHQGEGVVTRLSLDP